MSRALFALLIFSASASAQPLLYYRGVTNAASNMPQTLPGGGIAQGSIFSITGSGLGPSGGIGQFIFPLNTSLNGVTVTVSQGAASVSAYPIYADSGLIYAIMPSNAPLGMASVKVTSNSAQSNPLPVQIVSSSFGIFSMDGNGMGPGALQNGAAAGPVNSPLASASPDQTVTLWGTGLGPISGSDNTMPPVGNLSTRSRCSSAGKARRCPITAAHPAAPGWTRSNSRSRPARHWAAGCQSRSGRPEPR